jgi:hypothetical protein
MGEVALWATVAISSSAIESTETVGFGPLYRRLGAETRRESDEAMGAVAQLPAEAIVPGERVGLSSECGLRHPRDHY